MSEILARLPDRPPVGGDRIAHLLRIARTGLICGSVLIQGVGVFDGVFFMLTVPVSALLVLLAAVVEGVAGLTDPTCSALRSARNALLALGVGAIVVVAAVELATWGCEALGNGLKSFRM